MSGKLSGKARMVPASFRAEPEQLRKLTALGGGAWLRGLIDVAPWPRGTKPSNPNKRSVSVGPGPEGGK